MIMIDSLSAMTGGNGSSTAASRSGATTSTTSTIATGYLGMASGSGLTVPVTAALGRLLVVTPSGPHHRQPLLVVSVQRVRRLLLRRVTYADSKTCR